MEMQGKGQRLLDEKESNTTFSLPDFPDSISHVTLSLNAELLFSISTSLSKVRIDNQNSLKKIVTSLYQTIILN